MCIKLNKKIFFFSPLRDAIFWKQVPEWVNFKMSTQSFCVDSHNESSVKQCSHSLTFLTCNLNQDRNPDSKNIWRGPT